MIPPASTTTREKVRQPTGVAPRVAAVNLSSQPGSRPHCACNAKAVGSPKARMVPAVNHSKHERTRCEEMDRKENTDENVQEEDKIEQQPPRVNGGR